MASESSDRKTDWMKNGCNGFEMSSPRSTPMAFWTEQDVLRYISENDLEIASVYGKVVESEDGTLKTTGVSRSGCMFCGFGCHFPDDNRFVIMKESHPKQYEYIMKPINEGGLGYREVLTWINENTPYTIRF